MMRTLISTLTIFVLILLVFGEKVSAQMGPTAPVPHMEPMPAEPQQTGQTTTTTSTTTTSELPATEQLVRARAAMIEAKKAENEALAKIAKDDTKAMAKARKESQKEADRQKSAENRQAEAIVNAAIAGCEDGTVKVEPRATGSRSHQSYAKMRAVNLQDFTIDTIEDESGVVVRGLCGFGSISLFRSRDMWVDGNITFNYTARGRFPDGSLGIAKSPPISLTQSDVSNGNWQKFPNWDIVLQKVPVQR